MRVRLWVEAGFYLAAPVLFMLVPTSVFESAQSVCLFKNIFGVHCPGCGMTRALSCVFHGDLAGAWEYNRLVAAVFPLLGYVWLKGVASVAGRLKWAVAGNQ